MPVVSSTVAYIGAGLDTAFLRTPEIIGDAVCVDSRPASGMPADVFDDEDSDMPAFFPTDEHIDDEDFVPRLIARMGQCGFEHAGTETCGCVGPMHINDVHPASVVRFRRRERSIVYYVSHAFPQCACDRMRADLARCGALIVRGFMVAASILDLLHTRRPTIVCFGLERPGGGLGKALVNRGSRLVVFPELDDGVGGDYDPANETEPDSNDIYCM